MKVLWRCNVPPDTDHETYQYYFCVGQLAAQVQKMAKPDNIGMHHIHFAAMRHLDRIDKLTPVCSFLSAEHAPASLRFKFSETDCQFLMFVTCPRFRQVFVVPLECIVVFNGARLHMVNDNISTDDEGELQSMHFRRCAVCKAKDNLQQCGKCERIYYCSKSCQVAHWPRHKIVCSQVINHHIEAKGELRTCILWLNSRSITSFAANILVTRYHIKSVAPTLHDSHRDESCLDSAKCRRHQTL